jgi:antitoxin YefM
MQVISYSKCRENLAKILDSVVDNNETVIVTKNQKSAVLISLDEYNAWKESTQALKAKAQAKKINQTIKSVETLQNIISKQLNDD